jgi:sigma-B regulation protein RsbU (phosphoserine phosphatase)
MSPRSSNNQSRRRASGQNLFEYATLLEFSRVINSASDLSFMLGHILLTIMGKILSPRGMALLGHGKGKYRIEMVKGFSHELVGTEFEIPRVPQSAVTGSQLGRTRAPWAKKLRDTGVNLVLPMHLAAGPVGLLAFGARMGKSPFRPSDLTYLQSLANLSATAVQKSHSIAELELVNRRLDRKVQELNTLFDLGKEFGSLLDADKLVRLLVYSLLGQVGVNRYVICLQEGTDMRIVASRLEGQPPQPELLTVLSRAKSPVLAENLVVRHSVDPRPLLKDLGLTVIVPVRLKEESRGLILVGDKLSREPFAPGDLEFISSLGNLAMIALENARLFQETIEKQRMEDELLIAREIQKGLLPSIIPSLSGFDIAAANISSKQVGGDYYDVIPVDEHRHIIAIGDVSGKGTPAALLMANLQATIRALVPLQLPLSELTGRVNDLMCRNTGGNKFVTFFWGMLDPRAGTLTYVNAGHNYPMLLRANGTLERLEKGGMILGVLKTDAPYEEALVQLSPGDLLTLFTDGVSEAMSRDACEYGEDRLESVLRHSQHLPAQEILQGVHDDVLRHAKGASQSDDITLMILRVASPAAF